MLSIPASSTRGELTLRRWGPPEVAQLWSLVDVELAAGGGVRPSAWLESAPRTAEQAAAWLRGEQEGWRARNWLSFAVIEGAQLVGNVALKGLPEGARVDSATRAEVSYWTAQAARGRGVASDGLSAVTAWALESFGSLEELRAVHVEANPASCRVAERCGYPLESVSPADPPRWPHAAHVHVRRRPDSVS